MGNGVHDELIRKKDALDALMAERKHLLDKGRWGAEHVLTHHGYNVIDELPPVQSDVPDIYAGELISRRDATTIPVMPKEHREYQTYNLDDAYEQGWYDLQGCIENLPPVQSETPNNQTHLCAGCSYVYPECPASEADVVFGNGKGGDNICMCACFKPKEPKRGEWVKISPANIYECSKCGKHVMTNDISAYDFCHGCGADMRTKETDCDYERAVEQLEHDMLYEPTFDPDDGSM